MCKELSLGLLLGVAVKSWVLQQSKAVISLLSRFLPQVGICGLGMGTLGLGPVRVSGTRKGPLLSMRSGTRSVQKNKSTGLLPALKQELPCHLLHHMQSQEGRPSHSGCSWVAVWMLKYNGVVRPAQRCDAGSLHREWSRRSRNVAGKAGVGPWPFQAAQRPGMTQRKSLGVRVRSC